MKRKIKAKKDANHSERGYWRGKGEDKEN